MSLAKLSKITRPFNLPPKNKLFKKLFSEKDTTSKGYKLLLNYGIIHHNSTGLYDLLPMGQRIIEKLIKLIDQEMRLIGAEKMSLPLLTKQKLWEKSDTYSKSKEELYHVVTRDGTQFLLSPTHEQSFSNLLSTEVRSFKDFPKLLYQIGPKFRDEHRPKLGMLRSKEFLMKDLYSFDIDKKAAEETYDKVTKAYDNIFKALEIPFHLVESTADKSIQKSHEYFYFSSVGDDRLYKCSACKETVSAVIMEDRDSCPHCSFKKQNEYVRGIEIAHTFYFGTYYSDRLGSCYVNINCERTPLHMCSYGIGVSRLLSAVPEMLATEENELRWPLPMAPYLVCIIAPKSGSKEAFEVELVLPELYQLLNGVPVLRNDIVIDDRDDKTIGKRLMEAKLFGFPFIIVAGKDATLRTPLFELHNTNENTKYLMPKSSLVQYLIDRTECLTKQVKRTYYIAGDN